MEKILSYRMLCDTLATNRNEFGFCTWTIVWIDQLNSHGASKASHYKILLADPIRKETKSVVVEEKTLSKQELEASIHRSFIDDWSNRIKGIAPEKNNGFYEYNNWQDFKDDWLVRNEKVLLPYIYPLAFDLPSEHEFTSWQINGACKISYRRLIVTVYLYKKNVFHDIFIQNVTKADIEQYFLYTRARTVLDGLWN